MPIYFGDKIRNARKAAGLTQRQLADKIGVSNTSISNWEKNLSRPDPDTIQNLCWALGVQPNYFFALEDNKNPSDKAIFISYASQERTSFENTLAQTLAETIQGNPGRYNTIRLVGRDGSVIDRQLSDQQLAALKAILDQMPDVPDDL